MFHRAFLLHVAGSLVVCMGALVVMSDALHPPLSAITRSSWRSVDLNGCHDLKTFRVVVCLLVRVLLQHGMAKMQARCLAALCSLCPCSTTSPCRALEMKRVKQ